MRNRQYRVWRLLFSLALIGPLLWRLTVYPAEVNAHALLIRSIPAANAQLSQPPATIEMWFSEPLEAGFSHARLFNSMGAEVASGPAIIDPADPSHMILPLGQLRPGIYTVAWQTLSQTDGHEYYGSFPLTVLNPDGSRPAASTAINEEIGRGELPTPGEIAGRWLSLLGAMLFFGTLLFYGLVVRVMVEDGTTLADYTRALVLKALWAAALALVMGSWLQIILLTFRLGELSGLPNLLLGTRTGVLGLTRQALILTGLLLALWRLPPIRPQPDREPPFWLETAVYLFVVLVLLIGAALKREWLIAVSALTIALAGLAPLLWVRASREIPPRVLLGLLAALALFSFSLGSHAVAAPGWLWAVLGDYLHLLAAAAWLGGLLLLSALTWRVWQSHSPFASASLWPLGQGFSRLAGGAIFALTVTGLFNSLVQLPNLTTLFETAYGQVLLLKLGLMGLVLAVAFLNNRLVHQRARLSSDPVARLRFRGQVALEALIGLGLLVSVAVLVQTPTPASSAVGKPESTAAGVADYITQADDLTIHAQILPNQVGQNLFLVHLYHEDNSPIGEVQLVRLLFNYQEAQLGPAQADLTPRGGDIFGLEGAFLNQAGQWNLSIYVRRRGLDDSLAQVNVEVPALTGQTAPASPWQNPIPGLPPAVVMVIGAVAALGLLVVFWFSFLREIIKSKSSKFKTPA